MVEKERHLLLLVQIADISWYSDTVNIMDIFVEHADGLFINGLAASFYYKNPVCLSTGKGTKKEAAFLPAHTGGVSSRNSNDD